MRHSQQMKEAESTLSATEKMIATKEVLEDC